MGPGLLRPDTRIIERPGWYQVVTPSTPSSRNEVIWSKLEDADCARVIEQTIETYRALGVATKWCVGPWTRPQGFGERLSKRGFHSWGVRGMAAPTELRIAAPDGATFEEVDAAGLDGFVAAFAEGWGLSDAERALEREVMQAALRREPRIVHLFVARVDGQIAGTSGLLLRDGYAYLLGANVLPRFRGRGLYRGLVMARLEQLASRGVTVAVTQARAATSAPILSKIGFETVFESRCYRLE